MSRIDLTSIGHCFSFKSRKRFEPVKLIKGEEMKKILLVCVLIMGLSLLLWACKGKEEPAPAPQPTTPKAESPASPVAPAPVAKPTAPVKQEGTAKTVKPVKQDAGAVERPSKGKMKAPVGVSKGISIKKKKKDEDKK